ncbi:MAG: hypothetical protein Q7W30_00400 [Coriobacteriia bacterium]|nr:hypothetical protein [Coriobacteriia bacterium]
MRTASVFVRVLLVGCLVLVLAGCTPAAPPAGGTAGTEPAASTPAEQPAVSGGGGWLDGIPATVPKFEYGTFDNKQSSSMKAGEQTIYSLYYEGTTKEDVAAYIEKLKAAGFEVTSDPASTGLSAAGELKKGEEKLIGLSISWQDGGHVDYTINVIGSGQ